MPDILVNSGMTIVTAAVVIVELLSLLMMVVVVGAFRRVQSKQDALFMSLQGVAEFPRHRNVLLWVYILVTIVIGMTSLGIFLFQPHLL